MTEDPLTLIGIQADEHEAWGDVVRELRAAGAGSIEAGGANERLHDAITRWGEELAQLRLADPDPDHAELALARRCSTYARWTEGAPS